AEYKKYFETDAALKRRFQLVRVEEPREANAVRMLLGLVPILEKHHKVRIMDDAVTETVRLSVRYMPDRQLPDKAVSLLDTVCGRVALSQLATPPALEDAKREVEYLAKEIDFLEREGRVSGGNPEKVADLKARKVTAEKRTQELETQLAAEQKLVEQIKAVRDRLDAAGEKGDPAATAVLGKLTEDLAKIQGESPLVYPVVAGQAVAEVVARLTGVPLGKMVRNEIETLLHLPKHMQERVVGQDHAMEAIAERIRTARTDLGDPRRPVGVFLLVGPSGVGKTETAMALADLLYGGDRNMVVVNMSEYKESHKVSRLTGSAKGYVGYGEGGVLTNAVKNRPYSVVLLDEVEKADESVQEIFYQVFDKGVLQNDTGEDVNFKNTIILLTSNAGTDTIMKACADPETMPDAKGLAEVLRPDLLKWFKPALLGRMVVVPYFPLKDAVLKKIIELQLKKISDRLHNNYKATFTYDPAVVDAIAARCTEVESGARNVDHIITGTVLPAISNEILTRMADGKTVKSVKVAVNPDSSFAFTIE
ncbi:MAG: AAA family ATPase, partial [Gemmataceae bacterium]